MLVLNKIKILINPAKYFFYNTRGASATEYGVIVAGVALALIFVFGVLSGSLHDGFLFLRDTILNAVGSS
jgi:Flp pilus assembly pilin Flp